MDKYDIFFIWKFFTYIIKNLYEDRKNLRKRYLIAKKDWMMREYYFYRTKKSSDYMKKHPPKNYGFGGIKKVGVLK